MEDDADSPPRPAEGRTYPRTSVLLKGRFYRGKLVLECLITSLSAGGARLRTERALEVSAIGTLENERIGFLAGEVVWIRDGAMGLRFLERPHWVARLLSRAFPHSNLGISTDPDDSHQSGVFSG